MMLRSVVMHFYNPLIGYVIPLRSGLIYTSVRSLIPPIFLFFSLVFGFFALCPFFLVSRDFNPQLLNFATCLLPTQMDKATIHGAATEITFRFSHTITVSED